MLYSRGHWCLCQVPAGDPVEYHGSLLLNIQHTRKRRIEAQDLRGLPRYAIQYAQLSQLEIIVRNVLCLPYDITLCAVAFAGELPTIMRGENCVSVLNWTAHQKHRNAREKYNQIFFDTEVIHFDTCAFKTSKICDKGAQPPSTSALASSHIAWHRSSACTVGCDMSVAETSVLHVTFHLDDVTRIAGIYFTSQVTVLSFDQRHRTIFTKGITIDAIISAMLSVAGREHGIRSWRGHTWCGILARFTEGATRNDGCCALYMAPVSQIMSAPCHYKHGVPRSTSAFVHPPLMGKRCL